MAAVAEAFRAARLQEPLAFSGAIIPFKPPIDKVAAYGALSLYCPDELAFLDFCKSNDFSDEQIREWERKGVACIDVGARKYNRADVKEGSAVEYTFNHCALPDSAGMRELISLTTINNATGFLKRGERTQGAIAFLIREFYELPVESVDAWVSRVVKAAADVVIAYVKVQDGEIVRKDEPLPPVLQRIADRWAKGAGKTFTFASYLDDMWKLGRSPEEILEKFQFWHNAVRRYDDQVARSHKALKELKRCEFEIEGVGTGIVIRTDDYFLTKAIVRSGTYAVRVIIKRDGHAAITTNRLDLSSLNRFYSKLEPGRWFHDTRSCALLNGGPQYVQTPATQFGHGFFVKTLTQHLGPKVAKHQ